MSAEPNVAHARPMVGHDWAATRIHLDAATALLGERAANWKEDESARLILQTADRCDALHASVLRGARQMLKEYAYFAERFGGGDQRVRPPIDGSAGPDVPRTFVEYQSQLLALDTLVRAVLGARLEVPTRQSNDDSPKGGGR